MVKAPTKNEFLKTRLFINNIGNFLGNEDWYGWKGWVYWDNCFIEQWGWGKDSHFVLTIENQIYESDVLDDLEDILYNWVIRMYGYELENVQ